jgi:squalene-hopene/tetraprenyl-beta-curcumene cyclase
LSPLDSAGIHSAIINGLPWLLNLQNRDGGWPTFCRGWGHLPFDRSGTDLTAHAIRALMGWASSCATSGAPQDDSLAYVFTARDAWGQIATIQIKSSKAARSVRQGLEYLARQQRPDGSWLPLWFGNQHAPDDENPAYGTARVLAAYRDLSLMDSEPARRGVAWLLAAQNPDGGWGGAANTPSSVEETALAVEVLLDAKPQAAEAVERGLAYLVQRVEAGGLHGPTPIGFYFAKLWYYEKLYPIIFTVAALGRALRRLKPGDTPAR